MQPFVLQSFSAELEKQALSPKTVLSAMKARRAQAAARGLAGSGGSRVVRGAEKALEQAVASGAAHAPRGAGRVLRGLGHEVRGATGVAPRTAFNPQGMTTAARRQSMMAAPATQAARARIQGGYEAARSGAAGVRKMHGPTLAHAGEQGVTSFAGQASRPYTQAHVARVAGPTQAASPQLRAHDAAMATAAKRRAAMPTAPARGSAHPLAATQVGQVGGRSIDPLAPTQVGRVPGSSPASSIVSRNPTGVTRAPRRRGNVQRSPGGSLRAVS